MNESTSVDTNSTQYLLNRANSLINDKLPFVLIVVTKTWGSAPRQVGSLMLVEGQSTFNGSVSAGCVESAIVTMSDEIIEQSNSNWQSKSFDISNDLAWEQQLSCGGRLEVLLMPFISSDQGSHFEWVNNWLDAIESRQTLTLTFDSNNQLVNLSKIKETETFKYIQSQNSDLFTLNYRPGCHVIVVGAVAITQSISRFLSHLGHELTVIDPRSAWVEANPLATGNIIEQWPLEAFKNLSLDSSAAVIALTHDEKFDDDALSMALESDCFYIGALGSTRTQANRQQRLLQRGYNESQLSRIHGPIGLDINAKNPEEIALSIVAELTKVWRTVD